MQRAAKQLDHKQLINRANYWLARREYSVNEIESKLGKLTTDAETIEQVIKELETRGWLSQERFLMSFVRQKHARKLGPNRVIAELQQHGLDSSDFYRATEQQALDWQKSANALARRRAEQLDITDYQAKAKLQRFMYQRGFSSEQIKLALQQLLESAA